MKKLVVALALMVLLMPALPVSADLINFTGEVTVSDSTDSDAFKEIIQFLNPGIIQNFIPPSDPLFSDAGNETIVLPTLYIDPSSQESFSVFGVTHYSYGFQPASYAGGFLIYDDDGSLLLTADFTPVSLVLAGAGGSINQGLQGNLTNFQAGSSYTPGTSTIIDSFLTYATGISSVTFQIASGSLASAIQTGAEGDSFTTTYSGSAAVPEPTTLLLLGSGLVGMGVLRRRKK